ncbi:MAG TPA: transcriptional repressor NrdR [Candidatus Avilachnospira avistercoris]|nr:transcriptional repressor NrdR [Candidatus Avilachnospira avistercoris]
MKCPYCNAENTKVIDSRPADDNSSIRRRRQCESCGKRFTTYEKLETMPLMVIKKDNSREPYNRSKIEAGIICSCHKRPVSTKQISRMIDEIENELFSMEEKEIPTHVIGEKVMKRLKDLDEVAYVRFASVYREFKDVGTFIEEIGKLLGPKASREEPMAKKGSPMEEKG